MTKNEAIKEARIGVLMQGGTWYVVRRGEKYSAMHESLHAPEKGKVAEIYNLERVRSTPPPEVTQPEPIEQTCTGGCGKVRSIAYVDSPHEWLCNACRRSRREVTQ